MDTHKAIVERGKEIRAFQVKLGNRNHDVTYTKYIRLDLCECKDPHKNHSGFNWQEGSGTSHYPHQVVEEVTIDNGNPNRLQSGSEPYL